MTVIPHICQFWYTATLIFTPKSAEIRDKVANNSQLFAFYTLKSTNAREKYTTAGVAVVTSMSYVDSILIVYLSSVSTRFSFTGPEQDMLQHLKAEDNLIFAISTLF